MSYSAAPEPLILSLDGLPEGETEVAAVLPPGALGLAHADYAFREPAQVELRVRRSLDTFMVSGTARTAARGQCCRCLADTDATVQAEITVLYQRKQATADELEAVAEEDDVEIVSPGTRELDLRERVREALVLELPVRVYCRADCLGLCPQCGQDLNQAPCSCAAEQGDPRWQALRNVEFT